MSEALQRFDERVAALPDCSAIAREMMAQREFFSLYRDELPDKRNELPRLDLARYTGERSGDEAINLRVGAMRLLGMSDRAIERECGVDRRTIPHRLAWLEKARRIPAVKDRVLMRTADLAERSALLLGVLMDRAQDEVSCDLAAMIKALATTHGITVEKLQLLTGSPTEIIQEVSGSPREQTEDWLRANAIPVDGTETAIDLEAIGNRHEVDTKSEVSAVGYGQDTDVSRSTDPDGPIETPGRTDREGGGGGALAGGGLDVSMG